MTGESLPVDKGPGDEVSSGTVNQFGAFDMEATRVGEDSSIQRMIRLVQSADAGKAKIVGLADRWATWIVVIALTAAALTWLITGEIIRAVTILVVFCPCALVLATPTAIMAAIGNATHHGFLVREGDALERLAGVSKVTFDKTGTLTFGHPPGGGRGGGLRGLDETSSCTPSGRSGAALGAPPGQGGGPVLPAGGGAREPPRRGGLSDAPRPGRPGAGGRAARAGGEPAAARRRRAFPWTRALWRRRRPICGQGCTVIYLAAGRSAGGLSGPVGHPAPPGGGQVIQRMRAAGAEPGAAHRGPRERRRGTSPGSWASRPSGPAACRRISWRCIDAASRRGSRCA